MPSRSGSAETFEHGTLARRGELKYSLISVVICPPLWGWSIFHVVFLLVSLLARVYVNNVHAYGRHVRWSEVVLSVAPQCPLTC